MTSSVNPELYNVRNAVREAPSHGQRKHAVAQKIWWSSATCRGFELWKQTGRQTDRQTDRHTYHNNLHPSQGEV